MNEGVIPCGEGCEVQVVRPGKTQCPCDDPLTLLKMLRASEDEVNRLNNDDHYEWFGDCYYEVERDESGEPVSWTPKTDDLLTRTQTEMYVKENIEAMFGISVYKWVYQYARGETGDAGGAHSQFAMILGLPAWCPCSDRPGECTG